jgi:hypothetical protein
MEESIALLRHNSIYSKHGGSIATSFENCQEFVFTLSGGAEVHIRPALIGVH